MSIHQNHGNEGFYFVVVDGVPPYCQWQELKDYLRDFAKVSPGYANVLKVNEDGTRVGFCPLRNRSEADKAFDYLVAEGWRGLNIRVSIVWKADLRSDQIERKRGPEQSQRRRMPNKRLLSASFQRWEQQTPHSRSLDSTSTRSETMQIEDVTTYATTYYVDSIDQTLPSYSTMNAPSTKTTFGSCSQTSTIALSQDPHQRDFSTSQLDSRVQVCNVFCPKTLQHVHYVSPAGQEGKVCTNRSSIHISRLPHNIKTTELRDVLVQYGQVCDILIKRGKEKRCSATAKFERPEAASLAMQKLDGKRFDKLELVVRYDRGEPNGTISALSSIPSNADTSNVSHISNGPQGTQLRKGPLVVDGARGPGYAKNKGRDEDSEKIEEGSNEEDARSKPLTSTSR